MRIGKVKESIYKRSVLKQVNPGQKYSDPWSESPGDFVHIQIAPVVGWTLAPQRAVYNAVNALVVSALIPCAVAVMILMPEGTEEKQLKELMKELTFLCRREHVRLIPGYTAVSRAVNTLMISVTGIGQMYEQAHAGVRITECSGTEYSVNGHPDIDIPGMVYTATGYGNTDYADTDYSGNEHLDMDYSDMDILMVGHAGREGAALLAMEKDEELGGRYALSYIDTARHFYDDASLKDAAEIIYDCGAIKLFAVGEGGVFGALWEFASSLDTGLSVDLKKIPIRQHTIEICEYFNLNPYMLLSGGCLLAVCPDGERVVRELYQLSSREKALQKYNQLTDEEKSEESERAAQELSRLPDEEKSEEAVSVHKSRTLRDLQVAVIGRTTAGNDRLIHYDEEETRYLEPPKMDEIYKERI